MRRTVWKRAAALMCAGLVCAALWAEATQSRVADHVIRLHVLANSDSQADQALKRSVRDAVVVRADDLLRGRRTAGEAADVLARHLGSLRAAAAQVLAEAGSSYPVDVRLDNVWYPTRQYPGMALPAGEYRSLRVIIGSGQGHNWWCVVFPQLALPAVTQQSLAAGGLPRQDCALLTESGPRYAVKFKAVEWWETWKHRCSAWLDR